MGLSKETGPGMRNQTGPGPEARSWEVPMKWPGEWSANMEGSRIGPPSTIGRSLRRRQEPRPLGPPRGIPGLRPWRDPGQVQETGWVQEGGRGWVQGPDAGPG